MKPSRRVWIPATVLVIVSAGILWFVLTERSSTYEIAADRYREYADIYGPHDDRKGFGYSTCYGQRWDSFSSRVLQDRMNHAEEPAYLAERSTYYRVLESKYRRVVAQPWRTVRLDPPMNSP